MKVNWFKRKAVFYIPTSLVGWLILLACVVYAAYKFLDIDSRSHSASDTLINFAFYLLIIGTVYSALAYFTKKK